MGPPSGESCKSSILYCLMACSATGFLLTFLTCPIYSRMPWFAKAGSLASVTNPRAGSTRTVIELSPSNRSSAHMERRALRALIVSLTITK